MQDSLRQIDDLLARRDIKKAEVAIAKALRSAGTAHDRARALVYRARARLMAARPDDALDDLNTVRTLESDAYDHPEILELAADSHLARFELASVGFADRNDTATALKTYRMIVQNYPSYENLGWIYYQMGRTLLTDNLADEAVACFQEVLLHPSNLAALTAYCYERMAFVAYYEKRDLYKALTFVNKAVDTYPTSEDRRWLAQVHILRSRVLRDLHRFEQALRAAETALAVFGTGSNTEAKLGLAEAYLMTGELLAEIEGRERDVIAHLQQFLQMSKKPLGVDVTWSRVHEMLGDAYFKTGQYGLAASAYQMTLQFNPYHPWELTIHYKIARSYYQQTEYERTVQAIQRMMDAAKADGQTVSDYRVYDVLGNALFALGRYDDALGAYRTALQIAPPNADNLDKIKAYHDYARELSRAV